MIDKGYDLPNPYDIGYSYFDGQQRYQLSGLSISAGSAPLRGADFVRFGQSRIRNASNQVRVGAWLFLFMNGVRLDAGFVRQTRGLYVQINEAF